MIDYPFLRKVMANQEFGLHVVEMTRFLGDRAPFKQRLWHMIHDSWTVRTCKLCDRPVRWNSKGGGQEYRTFCSSRCAQRDQGVRERTQATCLGKYGYETNLQCPGTKQQIRSTVQERYGASNISKSRHFQEKFRATCLERYGVENPAQVPEVKAKIDQTHHARHGRKRQSQTHIPVDVVALKNNRDRMWEWHVQQRKPLTEIAQLLGVNHSQLCVHFRDNLGITLRGSNPISHQHRQVLDFLDQHGIDHRVNCRKVIPPQELDVVIHSHKVAIEVNGLAWHSERLGKKHSTYHLEKTRRCAQQGYTLIHIWDCDIHSRWPLVRSRLMAKLNLCDRIGARKCQIVEVATGTRNQFLKDNHIQGATGASVSLGLEYQGRLVAVMTFGRSRFNRKYQYELIRYCTEQSVSVQGGGQRLFSAFVKRHAPKSVISYCDRGWNQGTLYRQMGFALIGETSPNYWYTQDYRTLHGRQQFQKHRLCQKLANFDPDLTEWQNMCLNQWDRVWDCGNQVYVWSDPATDGGSPVVAGFQSVSD